MSIYQKLLNIQKAVMGLGKDANGGMYEYVTGSKVLGAIKPIMCKEGLILKQELINTEKEVIRYLRYDKYKKANVEKTEVNFLCTFRFTWIDIESGEKDENLFMSSGQNEFEKGIGSAMTYAERYFMLKYFHIATDSDDIDSMQEEGRGEALPEKTNSSTDKNKLIETILQEIERTGSDEKEILNKAKAKDFIHLKIEELQAIVKWLNRKDTKKKEVSISDIDKVMISTMEKGVTV